MASSGGGRSRADPAASSGGATSTTTTTSASTSRACEACDAAAGMAFCRVEWSFLCASCGPALHRNSWIVAVPPFPTATTPTTTTTPSQPPPSFFPPFMQMPLPPFHMQQPMPPSTSNPPNLTATNAPEPGTKRRRCRRSKDDMLPSAPTDTDADRRLFSQKRKTRLRPSLPPAAPTGDSTDSANANNELQPGVNHAIISNVPQSTGDEARVDEMEKFVTEMDPTELDEIGAEEEP